MSEHKDWVLVTEPTEAAMRTGVRIMQSLGWYIQNSPIHLTVGGKIYFSTPMAMVRKFVHMADLPRAEPPPEPAQSLVVQRELL